MRFTILMCLLVAACGGDDTDLDLSNRDPRCVSACPATMQEYEGVGEICSAASRSQCLDACEARIAGLPSTCQTCLLEDACFAPGGGGDGNSCGDDDGVSLCQNNMATVTGWGGSCSYPCDDQAKRLACLQQVMPTREATCTAEWRAVSECSSFCGN